MPRPRSPHQREIDREKVAQMLLQGRTIRDIAKTMGRGTDTVQRDVHALRAQWRERAGDHVQVLLAGEVAKLDLIEKTQWDLMAQAEGVKVKGDLLTAVRKTISTRCRVMGLERPSELSYLFQQVYDMQQRAHKSLLRALAAELPNDPDLLRRVAHSFLRIQEGHIIEVTPLTDPDKGNDHEES